MALYKTPTWILQRNYREKVIEKIVPALRQEDAKLHDVIHEILMDAKDYPKEKGDK